jgi:hypothetical protein
MLGRDCFAEPLVESRPTEGAAEDFGELGRKQPWAEKGREKGNSFSFSGLYFP